MDDGYYYRRDKCSYLYLGNVSEKEANLVRDTLIEKFSLRTKVKKKKKGYAVYFSPDETKKLKSLIKGYTLNYFSYKFPS